MKRIATAFALAVGCVVSACATSQLGSDQPTPDVEPADESIEEIGSLDVLRQLAERCHTSPDTGVSPGEMRAWTSALSDSYALWQPRRREAFREISEALDACDALEPSGAEGANGGGTEAGGLAGNDEAMHAVRRMGDAIRCLDSLAVGLSSQSFSASCARLVGETEPEPPTLENVLASCRGVGAPTQLPGTVPAAEPNCSTSSDPSLPVAMRTPETRAVIRVIEAASSARGRNLAEAAPRLFAQQVHTLDRALTRRLGSLRVPLSLSSRSVGGVSAARLPGLAQSATSRAAASTLARDALLVVGASESRIYEWPALEFDLDTGQVVFLDGEWSLLRGHALRSAHARSVSPERLSAAAVRELSPPWREGDEGSHADEHPKTALVLARRSAIWAALRPALCTAHDLGIDRFVLAGRTSPTVRGLREVPIYLDVEVRELDAAEQTIIELREDGFLVRSPNGDRRAIPFVEGDAFVKLRQYLEVRGVDAVAVQADVRVEIQLLALLADAVAGELEDPESLSSDRELFESATTQIRPEITSSVRVECPSPSRDAVSVR